MGMGNLNPGCGCCGGGDCNGCCESALPSIQITVPSGWTNDDCIAGCVNIPDTYTLPRTSFTFEPCGGGDELVIGASDCGFFLDAGSWCGTGGSPSIDLHLQLLAWLTSTEDGCYWTVVVRLVGTSGDSSAYACQDWTYESAPTYPPFDCSGEIELSLMDTGDCYATLLGEPVEGGCNLCGDPPDTIGVIRCNACEEGSAPAYYFDLADMSGTGPDDCDCEEFEQRVTLCHYSGCEYRGTFAENESDCWDDETQPDVFFKLVLGEGVYLMDGEDVLVSWLADSSEWALNGCDNQINLILETVNPDALFECTWPDEIALFPGDNCPTSCTAAPEGVPAEFSIDIALIANDACVDCTGLNGVYVLARMGANSCHWDFADDLTLCGSTASGGVHLSLTDAGGGNTLVTVTLRHNAVNIAVWIATLPSSTDFQTLSAEALTFNNGAAGVCDFASSTCEVTAV